MDLILVIKLLSVVSIAGQRADTIIYKQFDSRCKRFHKLVDVDVFSRTV